MQDIIIYLTAKNIENWNSNIINDLFIDKLGETYQEDSDQDIQLQTFSVSESISDDLG